MPYNRNPIGTAVGSWLVLLLLAPAMLIGSTTPTLELALFDRVHLSAVMIQEMNHEVNHVFSARRVEIGWLSSRDDLVIHSPRREIQVILSPSLPEVWGYDESVMGVVLAPGREGPGGVIVVFPARVAQVVGARRYRRFSARMPTDPRLARALGRIIAHEIIHVVAPDHRHGDTGIMHASQSRASLLEPEPRVDTACSAAFQTHLPLYLAKIGPPAPVTFSGSESPAVPTPE
jgi:hypothetical protein